MSHRRKAYDYTGCPHIRSDRARVVAELFRLDPRRADPYRPPVPDPARLAPALPGPGRITLLTGPSGAGKSTLLRQLRRLIPAPRGAAHPASGHGVGLCGSDPERDEVARSRDDQTPRPWLDLNDLRPPEVPLVDCFGETALPRVLALLGSVGLGEVWTFLRLPGELSDGQRWRLKLALAMHAARSREAPRSREVPGSREVPAVLIADEFAAVLDRVSAAAVARALRNAVDRGGFGAIVATSHDDLKPALLPNTIVRCDFGGWQVEIGEGVTCHSSLVT